MNIVHSQEQLAQAIQHHQRGELAQAESIYRAILKAEPRHADALHLLGVIANQCEQPQTAIELIRQAIAVAPRIPSFYTNLGLALQKAGRLSEAVDSFRKALEIAPAMAEAYKGLGLVFRAQGQLQSATEAFRQAVSMRPDDADAHCNLGVVLQEQEQAEAAVRSYQRAIQIQPGFAAAWHNLGNAYKSQWQFDAARSAYQRAIELKSDYADAYNNLGNVLHELGAMPAAIEVFHKAIQFAPQSADAHYNLGNAFAALGDSASAAIAYQCSLALAPDRIETAGALLTEYQHLCQWSELARLTGQVIEAIERPASDSEPPLISPFSYIALPSPISPELQFRCARRWAAANYRIPSGLIPTKSPAAVRRHRERLRIAYLSADYRSHAVAYMVPELFERHDRDRFKVFGYSLGPVDASPIRQRIIRAFDRFHDVRMLPFDEIARQIEADEIDILVDLQGHTLHARTKLLALRPAPIQLSYIGFPGTMGADFIDYILVDHFVVPLDQQPNFTERLVHLPGCYQVNDSRHAISPATPARADCGLPEDAFVFCSFNNSFKLTPTMFDRWMRLLHAVPESVLWLPEWKSATKSNLLREAADRGIDQERLVFAPIVPIAEHLARHRLANLFLDSYPYSAHATASISLRMGVPIVTLAGRTMASRVAGSLLHAVGLPELVTQSFEEYEARALQLATDREAYRRIRERLTQALPTSDLFQGAVFAKNVERAYQIMWDIYQRGEKPRPIDLANQTGDPYLNSPQIPSPRPT